MESRVEWLKSKGCIESSDLYKYYDECVDKFGPTEFDSYKRRCREAVQAEKVCGSYQQPLIERVVSTAKEKEFTVIAENILTVEDLATVSQIDLDVWECYKIVSNRWADRYQIKGWFRLRDATDITPDKYAERFRDLITDYVPPKVSRRIVDGKQKNLVEMCLFDFHFGQLSWAKETGDSDYDINIAGKLLDDSVNYFIERTKDSAGQFLIPIGNDFFNTDNIFNTTLAGTIQAEDTRWQKTFLSAEELYIQQIDKLLSIAPVHIVIVSGNHDFTRIFYLGEFLKAWYRNNENVTVDNNPRTRKYYRYGNNLIGYTHGNEEVRGSLPILMAQENPSLFAETKYHEFHLGHLHSHSEKIAHYTKDSFGIREVIISSLVPLDDWHSKKGYRHLREALAFEWDYENGRVTTYHYRPGM